MTPPGPAAQIAPVPPSLPEVRQVYSLFTAMNATARDHFAGQLGGRLVLYGALDAPGAAIALGANIAGAATLGIDPDEDRLKQGIRNSVCDFMVNTLDEALRILKNELRKKQPVSVCLQARFDAALAEIVERGVQPDIVAGLEGHVAMQPLLQRGSVLLNSSAPPVNGMAGLTWTAAEAPALWLPKADAAAAEALAAPNDNRMRWLKLAPRYLKKQLASRRYVCMTAAEADRFASLLAQRMADGTIGTTIYLDT